MVQNKLLVNDSELRIDFSQIRFRYHNSQQLSQVPLVELNLKVTPIDVLVYLSISTSIYKVPLPAISFQLVYILDLDTNTVIILGVINLNKFDSM